MLRFSVDGGLTYVEAREGLRVLYEELPTSSLDDDECQVLFNFTEEGLIIDITEVGVIIGSSSEMYDEIVDRLFEGPDDDS